MRECTVGHGKRKIGVAEPGTAIRQGNKAIVRTMVDVDVIVSNCSNARQAFAVLKINACLQVSLKRGLAKGHSIVGEHACSMCANVSC